MPIEGVVLQMKSMHIDAVVNFPFPTPPNESALKKAEAVLTHLGAVKVSPVIHKGGTEIFTTGTIGGHISELGNAMSLFPLSPRFSRMLVGGRTHGCLPYVVSIVAALSVGDPFLREDGIDDDLEVPNEKTAADLAHIHSDVARAAEARKIRRRAFFQAQQVCLMVGCMPQLLNQDIYQTHGSLGNSSSDLFRLLSVVGAYEFAGGGHKFCAEHFVRPKVSSQLLLL